MEQMFFPVTRREAERSGTQYSQEKNKKAGFPSRLRELRKEKGVSQDAASKELGVSKSTLGLWETGDTLPDAKSLCDLAKYFGVSADYLLGLAEERTINGDLAQACRYTGLPANAVTALYKAKQPDNLLRASLWVINEILGNKLMDFETWVWRAAISQCCPTSEIDKDELAVIRHNTDAKLLECAKEGGGSGMTAVDIPIFDYEAVCTSSALNIIYDIAKEAVDKYKKHFLKTFMANIEEER